MSHQIIRDYQAYESLLAQFDLYLDKGWITEYRHAQLVDDLNSRFVPRMMQNQEVAEC